jgi:hypothetical protein
MSRWSTLRVLNDSSLFDSRQLHSRSILACCMKMWAQWMNEHMLPFPRLIRELNFGVVVNRLSVKYEKPYTFFSADEFEMRGTLSIGQRRRFLLGQVHFMNGAERFLLVKAVLSPLTIDPECDLGAVSSRVEGAVLDQFQDDEFSDEAAERPIRQIMRDFASEKPIAVARRSIRIGRHDCEVADQWSYIEVAAHAASAREEMILDAELETQERLQSGLVEPIQTLHAEIGRPLFLFDNAEIDSTAYCMAGVLTFVHVYRSQLGGKHEHATVLEQFGIPESCG